MERSLCKECKSFNFCMLASAIEAAVKNKHTSPYVIIENPGYKKCPDYESQIKEIRDRIPSLESSITNFNSSTIKKRS
jgi:hypothetical protein